MTAADIWSRAYADASAWPLWNDALASAELLGPFAVGSRARMGHRHELLPLDGRDGVRLVNTIYVRGPLARLWALVLGPQAKRGLPGWQRRAAALAGALGDRTLRSCD